MRDWFDNLARREQIMVAAGAVVVVIALFYLLVWSPLSSGNERLRDSVQAKQDTLAELARWEGRVTPPSGDRSNARGGQSLVIVVSQSASGFQLAGALKSSQPVNANSIRVQMENASFDTLVSWLGELHQRHGLSVRSASFTRTGQSGRVNSTLTLERG